MSQREFEEKIRSIQRFTHFQLWQISWVFWELFFSKFSAVHKKILMFFKMHSKGFRTNWVWVIVFLIIFKISLKANKSVTAAGQTDWQHRPLLTLVLCTFHSSWGAGVGLFVIGANHQNEDTKLFILQFRWSPKPNLFFNMEPQRAHWFSQLDFWGYIK